MAVPYTGPVSDSTPARRFPVRIAFFVLAIVFCGAVGASIGWTLAGAIGLTGTPMALVAAFTGMVIATLLWIAGAAIFPRKPDD